MDYPLRMTPEEAEAAMDQILSRKNSVEQAHMDADEVLLALLRFYNENQIARKFESLEKFYFKRLRSRSFPQSYLTVGEFTTTFHNRNILHIDLPQMTEEELALHGMDIYKTGKRLAHNRAFIGICTIQDADLTVFVWGE